MKGQKATNASPHAETLSQCFFYSCMVAVEVGCKDPTEFKKREEVLQS